MSPKRSFDWFALSSILLLSLFGVSTAAFGATPLDTLISVDAPTDDPGKARVRVVHASPDAPSVDVLVDGAVVLADLQYPAVSDYLAVDPGQYTIQVVATGTTGPAVLDAEVDLAADTYSTVIATDTLANIRPTVWVDALDPTAASDEAQVRFFHGSPDAPSVDIVTLPDAAIVFGDVAFGETRDFVTVGAGSLEIGVRAAGSDSTVLARSLDLTAQTRYTVFAIGLLADGASDG